jgi:hypothetical protein
MRVRPHVRLVAVIWLTCQVAAFAASPYALCHDHDAMAQVPAGHECGRMCPMHHHGQPPASTTAAHEHHHHQSEAPSVPAGGASLNCRCTVSDAALAALIVEAGVVPPAFTLVEEQISTRVVLVDYAAPTRSQLVETPPPRA